MSRECLRPKKYCMQVSHFNPFLSCRKKLSTWIWSRALLLTYFKPNGSVSSGANSSNKFSSSSSTFSSPCTFLYLAPWELEILTACPKMKRVPAFLQTRPSTWPKQPLMSPPQARWITRTLWPRWQPWSTWPQQRPKIMVIWVVEFSSGGYKIRKIFA